MSNVISVIDSDTIGPLTSSIRRKPSASGAWGDWVGMVASIGCAIHCAAMPFAIAYLPALGLSFLADEAFHKWMAVACFVIALLAFLPGLRKHGRCTPVIIASVGLVMISVAAFGFAGECCPSCDADGTHIAATGTVACTDASCPLCARENPAASATSENNPSADQATFASQGASLQAASPWVSRIVPWLTPLGGLVLVSAHLLNRRYGCLCGCCDSEPFEGAAA